MRKLQKRLPLTPAFFTDLYLFLMLGIFPLLFGADGYLGITAVKFRAFVLLSGVYLLAVLISGLVLRRRKPQPRRGLTATQCLVLAYLLLSAVSALLSPWRSQTLLGMTRSEGLLTICLYGLVFLAVSRWGRPAVWQLWVFGAAMTVFCAISFLQLAGGNPFGLYPDGTGYSDGNVLYAGQFLGTVGNVDLDAALLSLAVPAFCLGIFRLRGARTFLLAVPAACCLVLTVLMRVSAGLLGAVGGLVLSLPLLGRDCREKRLLTFGVGGLLLAALAAVWLCPGLPGMLGEAHELLHGRAEDSFGNGRILIWRNVWALVRERPLFGGGPDTLYARMAEHVYRWNNYALGGVVSVSTDVAHNEYLNILVCQGLFALAAYLSALGCSAALWLRRSDRPAVLVCGGAVLGYGIQAFFGFSMCLTAPLFWICLALLNAAGTPVPAARARKK